jgi:hypothetical protein
MGWDDRKRQAALTTPDNKRFEFDYEDLERSRAENASIFKFAEKSGARIPRQSSGHDIYPLTAIFNGDNYDIIGEEFWQATKVPGEFFLEHPRFVGIKRVQLMTIRQRVAAKSGDNETKFDMVLHETLPESLPSTALDATTQILNTGLELLGEAGDSYAGNVELDNALVVGELQAESTSFIDDVNSFFADIAAQEAALSAAFDAQFLSVSAAIDNMVDGPLEFANNAAIFVATPSRVAVDIGTRITAYEDLFDNTIDRLSFAVDEVIDAAHNRGALAMLTSMGIISGMCQSAVSDASYLTRGAVLNISDRIVAINDRTIAMLDEYSDAFNDEDDPADRRFEITEATNILNDLVSLTTGRLYDVAFTLKQERIIVFDTERDTVTLTHELYGYTDADFDFLVATNKLKSDELYFIPPYKEIVYYI